MKNMLKKQTKYEILTPNGWRDFSGINKVKKTNGLKISTNYHNISTTTDHKIDTPTGYKKAYLLNIGDEIVTKCASEKIVSIEKTGEQYFYDLINVQNDRHIFYANDIAVSNCAFIPKNIWTDFFSSVYPTVASSKTSKTILVSTPNGMNHFYRYWIGATTDDPNLKNTFNPIKVHWSQVPGRDEKWYKDTLSNMSAEEFAREFEGEFLGSSLTLIKPETLRQMSYLPEKRNTLLHERLHEFELNLRVFKLVKPGHRYVMSVDSSKVREDSSGDPVGIQVIDITRFPFQQVAVFQAANNMHYLQIPQVAYEIGRYYNWAFAFVENNEIGQQIADSIAYEFEYENMYFEKPNLAGYRTTKTTKRLGCSNIKAWIERKKLKINDPYTIEELSTFIKKPNGTFSADADYTDDLVMALIGCLFFTTRPEFDSFTNVKAIGETLFNDGKTIEVEEALMEDLPSFGVVDADGIDDLWDDDGDMMGPSVF